MMSFCIGRITEPKSREPNVFHAGLLLLLSVCCNLSSRLAGIYG
jgi:hypothetical protein